MTIELSWLVITFVILSVWLNSVRCVSPPPYSRDPLAPAGTVGAAGEMEDMEFRIVIDPGRIECFFQEAKRDHTLEVSYQVIELNSRFSWLHAVSKYDLKISFSLRGPTGNVIVEEFDR